MFSFLKDGFTSFYQSSYFIQKSRMGAMIKEIINDSFKRDDFRILPPEASVQQAGKIAMVKSGKKNGGITFVRNFTDVVTCVAGWFMFDFDLLFISWANIDQFIKNHLDAIQDGSSYEQLTFHINIISEYLNLMYSHGVMSDKSILDSIEEYKIRLGEKVNESLMLCSIIEDFKNDMEHIMTSTRFENCIIDNVEDFVIVKKDYDVFYEWPLLLHIYKYEPLYSICDERTLAITQEIYGKMQFIMQTSSSLPNTYKVVLSNDAVYQIASWISSFVVDMCLFQSNSKLFGTFINSQVKRIQLRMVLETAYCLISRNIQPTKNHISFMYITILPDQLISKITAVNTADDGDDESD